jgi:hypothetical protein
MAKRSVSYIETFTENATIRDHHHHLCGNWSIKTKKIAKLWHKYPYREDVVDTIITQKYLIEQEFRCIDSFNFRISFLYEKANFDFNLDTKCCETCNPQPRPSRNNAMPQNSMLRGMETFLTLSRLFRDCSLCGSSDPLGNLVPCPGILYLKIGNLGRIRCTQVVPYMLMYSTFFGPKWHSPNGSLPFHRAPKSLDFQGTTPAHLPSY